MPTTPRASATEAAAAGAIDSYRAGRALAPFSFESALTVALPDLSLSLQFGRFDGVARHRAALPRHRVARCIRHALALPGELTAHRRCGGSSQRLNRELRGKDYATNVLTFDYAQSPMVMADLVLCAPVSRARSQRTADHARQPLRPPAGARHAARARLGPRDRRGRRRSHGSARDRDPGRPRRAQPYRQR